MNEPTEQIEELANNPISASGLPALFKHKSRPQWGLAIVAWEREGKRGYQFEDGELRVFKDGFFHLLDEVVQPLDEAAVTVARLARAAGVAADAAAADGSKPPPKPVETFPFDKQVAVFMELYPGGFEDDAWKKKMRGSEGGRRAKSHREPAVLEAREKLALEQLEGLIDANNLTGVVQLADEVLGASNLTTNAQRRPISEMSFGREKLYAPALVDLLWGPSPIKDRFDSYLIALGKTGWPLSTALISLVHPDKFMCVHPGTFKSMAAWFNPRMRWPRKASGIGYVNIMQSAKIVRDKLGEAGLVARDYLDVYDFIKESLTPASRKKIEALVASEGPTDLSSVMPAPAPAAPAPAAPAPAAPVPEPETSTDTDA